MIAYFLVATLHVLVCIILILVVLLQSGKGADLAGAFGGGATQTVFGSRGPASFLSKLTTIAAVVFMITSIGLSLMSTRPVAKSLMDQVKTPAAKPATSAPPAAPGKALTPDQLKRMQEDLAKKASEQKAAPAVAPAAGAATQKPAEAPAAPVQAPAKKQ
jgi:preprotein translocase subunit SecG